MRFMAVKAGEDKITLRGSSGQKGLPEAAGAVTAECTMLVLIQPRIFPVNLFKFPDEGGALDYIVRIMAVCAETNIIRRVAPILVANPGRLPEQGGNRSKGCFIAQICCHDFGFTPEILRNAG